MYPLCNRFRGRYCQSESHANLAVDSLDPIITSVATNFKKGDPFSPICEQWAKTKKLTSVQLPSVLWHAVEDDELQSISIICLCIRVAQLSSKIYEVPLLRIVQPCNLLQLKIWRCSSSWKYI